MQASLDGEAIQFRNKGSKFEWHLATVPIWDWDAIIYRVKPEDPLSLEDRIKAEFPGKRVVMLATRHFLGIAVDIPIDENLTQTQFMSHTVAQSMKGFAGYVYEENGDIDPGVSNSPTTVHWSNNEEFSINQPVAVLFLVQS